MKFNMKILLKNQKNIQKKFNNLGIQKFEVISSQFTFHYYLETEDKFKNMEDILKQQAESVYQNTINTQGQNRMPGVSSNLYQKNKVLQIL